MIEDSSTVSWNQLGKEWYHLAQNGESRMYFIMPYMLELIGEVEGSKILDIGCGEGGYSRELCRRGAELTSIDCNHYSIEYAKELAFQEGLMIKHYIRNSNDLYGIEDKSFDLVLSSMMLMDVEDMEGTIREIVRALKPGGHLYVSMLHPCFDGNHEHGIGRQGEGINREVVIKNYFHPKEWEAVLPNGTIPVIWRHRTLHEYVNVFVSNGLIIDRLEEPAANDEQAKLSTSIAWLQKIPLFLFWQLHKG